MYNAITSWLKNNVLDTFTSRTESDYAYSQELRNQYSSYNNTVILREGPSIPQENLVQMDIEICGKIVKPPSPRDGDDKDDKDDTDSGLNIILTNEKGDELKRTTSPYQRKQEEQKPAYKRPTSPKHLKPEYAYKQPLSKKPRQKERRLELEQDDDNSEELDIAMPFRALGGRSSMTNLHSLMEQCPEPQPPLTHKQLRTFQLNEDQADIMKEQVRKMKTGMERLQDIIKKFNCTEKFRQDVDFIIANVGPAIAKAEHMKYMQKTSAPCMKQYKQ